MLIGVNRLLSHVCLYQKYKYENIELNNRHSYFRLPYGNYEVEQKYRQSHNIDINSKIPHIVSEIEDAAIVTFDVAYNEYIDMVYNRANEKIKQSNKEDYNYYIYSIYTKKFYLLDNRDKEDVKNEIISDLSSIPNNKKIIAICGLAGAGKDTTADKLIENFTLSGLTVEKHAFADKLKDTISVLFDLPRDKLAGFTPEARAWREQELPNWTARLGKSITPRNLMQTIGSELLRDQFYKDIWIACLQDTIQKSNANVIIITDCRYENEMQALQDMGAVFIEVRRDEPNWVKDLLENNIIPQNIHQSEYSWIKKIRSMENNKFTLLNDSDINILYDKINNIYTTLIKE